MPPIPLANNFGKKTRLAMATEENFLKAVLMVMILAAVKW
jgi:hypothetical protein